MRRRLPSTGRTRSARCSQPPGRSCWPAGPLPSRPPRWGRRPGWRAAASTSTSGRARRSWPGSPPTRSRTGGARVSEAARRARDADGRIDAYVRTTLELACSGAHRIAVLAGGVPVGDRARERLAQAHRDLAAPLSAALADRGDPDPGLTAELIDGALGRAIGLLDAGRPAGMLCRRRWRSCGAPRDPLPRRRRARTARTVIQPETEE
jgi:hypothetical protein